MLTPPRSTNQTLAILIQQYQVNPVTKPVLHRSECLPLSTPVLVRVGREVVIAVVSGYNPNDMQRVRVSWFDRTEWQVRHKFVDQQTVAVLRAKEQKTAVA